MANNPYVNKVEYAGQTLMDLTGDTVQPSNVLNGVTFHDRSGTPQQGSMITHDVYDGLDSSSANDALSANQGRVLNNRLSGIGTTVTGNNGTSTSVPDSTATKVNEIILDSGLWLVIACGDWQANGTGYRQIAFTGSGLNPNRSYAVTASAIDAANKETYQQATVIVASADGTTIPLYALQNSGNAINVYSAMYAVRLKTYS